jgi:acyl-CoA synthetase (NDP forming)
VYPVNPASDVVQSVRAYTSVGDVPGEVELAVIAVPAEGVVSAARECAERGVRALLVISAGFAETGREGLERQRDLLAVCRTTGMRLIGPNCLGILNTAGEAPLNATFAPVMPSLGNVGFVSQSGALGLALIDLAGDLGLGISSFASIGNRADITSNDVLEYWEDDDGTDVTLLYIESFSDPRRFSRIARRIGRRKPIVAVKSGRSQAGARATSSHTGALLAASDVTVDALFEQAGVIRTDSLADLLDVASLLASQPLPRSPRVAIVTNAGGPGIMCADACEAAGLEIPSLPDSMQETLRDLLPAEASLTNPVDMIATATAEHYRQTIATLATWEGIDALIVIFVRPLLTRAEDVAQAIREAIGRLPRRIPMQAVFMSAQDRDAMAGDPGIPTYLYPEHAARALAKVMHHAEWRRQPAVEPPDFGDVRPDEAAAIIAEALEADPGWLGVQRVTQLLDCYGIPVPESRTASDPVAAGHAAEELGGRVALKAFGPDLVHKTDVGAVKVGISGGAEASWAAVQMDEALERAGVERQGFLVQRMVETGVEMLIGVVEDAVFGPVVACGAGGVQAEVLQDISVRISPLTRRDAHEMLRSLTTFPLLTGYRGSPHVDLEALEDTVLRVSALVDTHHEVAELDLNPVLATGEGVLVVDARVRVESAPAPRPWPSSR